MKLNNPTESAGGGDGSGPLWTVEEVSGAVSPTTGDSGTLYDFGATGSVAIPDITGFNGELRFAVRVGDTVGVTITVPNGGKIEFVTVGATPVSSSAIFAAVKGAFISVVHVGSNIWQAMELIGPWADDS